MIKRVLSKLRKVTMSLFAVLCAGAVWAEEGEVTTPEVTPEPEPTPSTSALALDPSAGYVLTGLGELGDQAVVVFTNSAAAVNWTVPKNLKNVEMLVVGGGGGGGGHYYSSTAKNCQGGAGGGAGAVVTGFIKDLAANQVVNVTVGAGGAGGAATTSATTGAGKGGNGGNSVLKVGDVTYVTAYGGGGDGGYNSAGVANGGSNSGVRGTKTAANLKSVTVVGEGAENLVSDIVARANKGGGGYTTSSGYPGAGGGGAMSEGGASGGSSLGGICGYGYVSMITGTRTVYGAGGGGGIGKNGGTGTYLEEEFMPFIEGAGLGVAGQPGSDALANQGAGGGGGSWKQKGGNGGSGIVVLRFAYSDVDIPVDVAANILSKISDKAYTGEALVSGLENTYAYTVEELGERINFGQQTVRVTLNDGYVWADGDTNKTKEFNWNITQEVNNWKVEPYLSHTAWPQNFASSVNFKFTAPETSFGVLQAELSANGAAPQSFSGTLPTEPGSYTLKYWVEETANWAAKEWTVNFKIYRSEAFAEGYKVYGLGENGDEVAVVFTQNASWTVPANLKSAQFLVVGGGGGGGADPHYDAASGGAGGGGGGVVTGEVDLTKAATVAVTIGAGGAGGKLSTDQKDGASSGYYYGGSKKGGNTVLKVDGTTYVTAYGGGRDQGVTKKNSSSITTANMREGGQGGSNAGSRGGITTAQSKNPTMGAVADNAALHNCTTYGNKGGKGCSENFYGFPSAGGGGGATEAGGDAGNNAAGWPGGKGGEGLASDITGARLVYGSGGGGASTQGSLGGIGGSGAGNGGDRSERTSYGQGTSALANQGGGGGGTSREITNGGNGGSGVVVIRYSVYAAEVDGVPYATLSDAFDAAEDGATVKLLNDAELAEKVTIKTALTLDLNGCTLSETVTDSYGAIYIGTAGNLTITDSATGGKIATDGGIVIGNYGTVTVAGGTIEAGAVAEEDASIYNFYYNGSTYGKLTVNGGKVGRIWNCGNANVTAGEVVDIDNSGAMTIAEAATVSGSVVIKDGSDAADVPGAGTLTAPETLTVQVGNEGYFASYTDGKWVLEEAIDDPFVVNGEHYATFAAAYAAVEDGGEITIDERAEGTAFETPGFVLNKSVTIDLKDRTLTLTPPAVGSTGTETLGIQILPAAGRAEAMNVIIENGTINVAESNLTAEKPIKMMINNYVTGALTLENVTLDGTNLVKPSNMPIYVLSNNRGNVALTGETSVVAPEGAVAFDVCKYASYAVPTVTLNTTGTIAGKVEVSGGDFVIGDENTAEISAIDFTAGSVKGNVEEVLAIPEDKKLVETDGVYTLADKDVLAKVGDKLFETIAEAFAAAQAGDTVVLKKNLTVESALIIPEGVTLDLNGKTFTGDALGVVAVNKGTYVTPQNYKMVGPDADYYKSENAVLTIGATSITLNSGSLEVVPTEWWTLPGQTLTIDAGAEFIIPAGKKMNNNGSTVVIKGTLSGDGAINLYSLDATVQGAEGLNITTTVEGYCVAFANGVYKLEEIPAEFAAQVGETKYATLAAALADEANLSATIELIANTKENVTIPAGFTGTIDLNGFTLTGRIDSYATGAVLKNGSVIHTAGSKAAIQIEAGSLELTDINMESNYHGVRLNGAGTTATINSGTYRITSSSGTYNLIYASGANAKFYVYGGEFYNNGDTGSTWVLKAYASGAEINVYGGTFSAYSANTFEVAKGGVIKVFGGTFTGCNPSATTHATVQPGYAVEGTGPWTVVASWTAPMPEKDGEADITEEYTPDVLAALEAAVATSVDVKVNGTTLKGNEAVKALNTAVKCFDGALTFDGTAASVDIVIEVTEVNTEDPAASTVVVKRGETVLSVKTGVKPTVKYIDLGSDAVVFKLVFE